MLARNPSPRMADVQMRRNELTNLVGEEVVARLDREGLAWHESTKLPASALAAADIPRRVVEAFEEINVEKLAGLTKTAALTRASKSAPPDQKPALRAAAEALWQKARAVVRLIEKG
jgi:hypothetical protein